MSLVSLEFSLWAAAVVLLYSFLPKRFQWKVAMLVSDVFYAIHGIEHIAFLVPEMPIAYLGGRWMQGACDCPSADGEEKECLLMIVGTLSFLLVYAKPAHRGGSF